MACIACALGAAAPAHAAFPGIPGSIVYSRVSLHDHGDEEVTVTGGLTSHSPLLRGGTRKLTRDGTDGSPSYSADGKRIVFTRAELPFNSAEDSPGQMITHLFVMNADGSDVVSLTSGPHIDADPSFSPDGREIVFDRTDPATRSAHIFTISAAGGEPHQLTDEAGIDTDPTYAPNGKWIAFTSNRDRSARRDFENVFAISADGSHLRLLVGGPFDELQPDISPDGRRIAFVSDRQGKLDNIFVATAAGKRVRQLTRRRQPGETSESPSWAPDGKHIAYIKRSAEGPELEVMRADGRYPKPFALGELARVGLGAPSWGVQPR